MPIVLFVVFHVIVRVVEFLVVRLTVCWVRSVAFARMVSPNVSLDRPRFWTFKFTVKLKDFPTMVFDVMKLVIPMLCRPKGFRRG